MLPDHSPNAARRPRRRRIRLGPVLLGLALGLAAVELAVRALAPIPAPSREESFHREIAIADRERLYRLRAGARSDWSRYSAQDDRAVPFSINAEGRRARELDTGGAGAELRVAFLGDSTTMGFGVGDEEHFAYRFGELLARRHPERRVRVFNFGTHGYTSAQGRVQLEHEVASLRPELVVIAFGYNDSYPSSLDESSARAASPPRAWAELHELLEQRCATYHLLWKLAHPLRTRAAPSTRLSREEFAANLRALATRAQSFGARAVLIDSCIPHSFFRETTKSVAAEVGAPYLCLRELLERAALTRGRDVIAERRRGEAETPFLRVRWRSARDAALVLIDRADPTRLPRLLPLRDDGREGDEVAGDGIHTLIAPVLPTRAELEWTLVDRARIEAHALSAAHRFYRLLELEPGQGFDAGILDADAWLRGFGDYLRIHVEDFGHPNAEGHAEIARALDELLAS